MNASETNKDLLLKFGEKKIEERFKYLYQKMNEYIIDRGIKDKVIINTEILNHVIIDYFNDIKRLKDFHEIDNSNNLKIVAYISHWILKRKPLQIVTMDVENNEVFVNEKFVLLFLIFEFLTPNETVVLSKKDEEKYMKYIEHLLYHLKYRALDAQTLELVSYSFITGKLFHSASD